MTSNYYQKQIMLDEVGVRGQAKFKESKVLVIGAGGLGNPASIYLAASGVGTLGIIDGDVVEINNLNRQICFRPHDLDKMKATILSKFLIKQNPNIIIKPINSFINIENIEHIISEYDFILDCTDSIETKFLIHDFCYKLDKDLVQASIYKFEGKLISFPFSRSKEICWRCLWSDIPSANSCTNLGALGAVLGIFGPMQAMECLKLILGLNTLNLGEELIFDLNRWETRLVKWKKNSNCKLCVQNKDFWSTA